MLNIKKSLNSASCINCCSNDRDIAQTFCAYYDNIYNSPTVVDDTSFSTIYEEYVKSHTSDKGASIIDIDIIEAVVKSLKADGIVSEHVSHSHPALIVHLKLLFSLILKSHSVQSVQTCTVSSFL